jgi:hypothetical protein
MTSIFGLASLGIGILLVIKCANLPVMVLSTLVARCSAKCATWRKALIRWSVSSSSCFRPKGAEKGLSA